MAFFNIFVIGNSISNWFQRNRDAGIGAILKFMYMVKEYFSKILENILSASITIFIARKGYYKTSLLFEMFQTFSKLTQIMLFFKKDFLNPIPHGFWNNVSTWVGAIMAPTEFRLYMLVNSQLSTQKLFSDEYFDVLVSIDTKISPLCNIVWAL